MYPVLVVVSSKKPKSQSRYGTKYITELLQFSAKVVAMDRTIFISNMLQGERVSLPLLSA